MLEPMEVFIKVPVSSQEEADRLLEASYSGLLSDLVLMWLKYGDNFTGVFRPVQQVSDTRVTVEKPSTRRDPEVKLKPVTTEVGALVGASLQESPVVSKPKGIAGRNRMRRT